MQKSQMTASQLSFTQDHIWDNGKKTGDKDCLNQTDFEQKSF